MKLALEICEDCEKTFYGGAKAFLCPACRKKRLSQNAKNRNLSKLGADAYSAKAQKRKDIKKDEL